MSTQGERSEPWDTNKRKNNEYEKNNNNTNGHRSHPRRLQSGTRRGPHAHLHRRGQHHHRRAARHARDRLGGLLRLHPHGVQHHHQRIRHHLRRVGQQLQVHQHRGRNRRHPDQNRQQGPVPQVLRRAAGLCEMRRSGFGRLPQVAAARLLGQRLHAGHPVVQGIPLPFP